ncbi:MAG: cytochrome ubiquinol oxidase subunit I, partial [Longimicrobiales bacterium]
MSSSATAGRIRPRDAARVTAGCAAAGCALLLLVMDAQPLLAQAAAREYGDFPVIGSRAAVWVAAQVHLLFAAFVLGVPMFAVGCEAIGMFSRDDRYDRLSKEFTRLLLIAYSATAIWGAVLTFLLLTLYPRFWTHLSEIFAVSMWIYVGIFFLESFTLYLYYYGWDRWKYGAAKYWHLGLGVLLNVFGTAVMFIADGWLSYMMSPPAVVTPDTAPASVQLWSAIANATWMPINIHRFIANIVFGGTVAAAYAAYRFLSARTDEERALYDWMGYVGNFIAISALLILPFAGYWLGREIYEFNQQMGITMMGGFMSWLWIIQAFLIGVLFLAGNYY